MSVAYFRGAGRPAVQEDLADEGQHRRQIARTLNQVQSGNDNSTFTVTLDAGASATVILDPRISFLTVVNLMPQTPNARTALNGIWITCGKGQAVINHPVSGATDRIFTAGIQG